MSYSRPMRILVCLFFFSRCGAGLQMRSDVVVFKCSVLVFDWQTPADCVVSPGHTADPARKLHFPFRRDTCRECQCCYPFCCCDEPSSSPFEMQNHNVFSFLGQPQSSFESRHKPERLQLERAAVILIVRDLPAALVDIKPNRPWPVACNKCSENGGITA